MCEWKILPAPFWCLPSIASHELQMFDVDRLGLLLPRGPGLQSIEHTQSIITCVVTDDYS